MRQDIRTAEEEKFPELEPGFARDMTERLDGLSWRAKALNEGRNARSAKAGDYQEFTPGEKSEYDALQNSAKMVKGLCSKAAELANITTGVDYIGKTRPEGGTYDRLQSDSFLRADQLEAKTHPRVMRQMAELYQQAAQELLKYPKYNLDGQEKVE